MSNKCEYKYEWYYYPFIHSLIYLPIFIQYIHNSTHFFLYVSASLLVSPLKYSQWNSIGVRQFGEKISPAMELKTF